MRKVLFLLVLLGSTAMAQESVEFISAEQYQTGSAWHLSVLLDWSGVMFPPHNFEKMECLLSTIPLDISPPYTAMVSLQTTAPDREVAFSLLGPLDKNTVFYGRFYVWADGAVYIQSDPFTFSFPDDTPKFYTDSIPWASVDEAWQTSFAFHNPADENVNVTYRTWTGPEQNSILLESTVTIWPHQTYAGYLFPGEVIHSGVEIQSTFPITWMSLLNLRGTGIWIGFNGKTE